MGYHGLYILTKRRCCGGGRSPIDGPVVPSRLYSNPSTRMTAPGHSIGCGILSVFVGVFHKPLQVLHDVQGMLDPTFIGKGDWMVTFGERHLFLDGVSMHRGPPIDIGDGHCTHADGVRATPMLRLQESLLATLRHLFFAARVNAGVNSVIRMGAPWNPSLSSDGSAMCSRAGAPFKSLLDGQG